MNLKIKDILKATSGTLLAGNEDAECEDFSVDTRTIKTGDTYIALNGGKYNGNLFWKEAFCNGASTVIIEDIEVSPREIEDYRDKNKNIIKVENTRNALKEIARAKRNLYKNWKDLIVVAVTGSVGKTSTKDVIANVLSQKYKTLKTEGNMNNDIGLPLTILKLKDHEALVVEMGMNHLGEISELSKIARPLVSVITNVGTAHIGNLGSRENILKAKLEILDGMDLPIVVINNDNDMLNKWAKEHEYDVNIRQFGIQNRCECMAKNIEKKENCSKFICEFEGENFEIKVPVGGDVFILNALCATMVGRMLNLSNEQITKGIATFELTKKRMEITKLDNNVTIINDTYNASVDSMIASIKYLSEMSSKRKIAVLGDMFELGDFSEELHRKVGEAVAKNKIDLLFIIGENSKFIGEEAYANGMKKNNIFFFEKKEELLEKIRNIINSGDAVLFKASNGMKLFEVVEKLLKKE